MIWECKTHPGCIWSCNCECENCTLYNKTYIDTEKQKQKQKQKQKRKIKTTKHKTISLSNNDK